MPQQNVERFDQPPLEFDGHLLATAITEPVLVGSDRRQFRLSLFRSSDAGFVVAIDFLTTNTDEQNVSCAELVDLPEDVENFFFAFEPDEYLRLGNVQVDCLGPLASDLYSRYEVTVREILAALSATQQTAFQSQASTSPSDGDHASPDPGDEALAK